MTTGPLRALGQADAPSLAALHRDSFGPEAWSAAQLCGSLALPTTQGYALDVEGALAGFILCQVLPDEAEILTLCVHPRHRRCGLGEALLRGALGRLAPGTSVFLEVAQDNEAACRLYEKGGFVLSGRRKNYYKRDGGAADALCYRLETE